MEREMSGVEGDRGVRREMRSVGDGGVKGEKEI